MKSVIIDVVGTIKELVKWALKEALLLIGILVFGLSAPLLSSATPTRGETPG